MSLFEELFAKFKAKKEEEEKNVPFVTCVREREKPKVHHHDLYINSDNSATCARVTGGTLLADPQPGECDLCPACGYWEGHGPEPFCFYEAYFLAKPAKPMLAKQRRNACPLEEGK